MMLKAVINPSLLLDCVTLIIDLPPPIEELITLIFDFPRLWRENVVNVLDFVVTPDWLVNVAKCLKRVVLIREWHPRVAEHVRQKRLVSKFVVICHSRFGHGSNNLVIRLLGWMHDLKTTVADSEASISWRAFQLGSIWIRVLVSERAVLWDPTCNIRYLTSRATS
jgi:hypothetical protein